MADTRANVLRFLAGQRAAERRQRQLLEERGPQPEQAIAECLDVLAALERMGVWPGPRDPVHERDAEVLRARWARLKRGYRCVTRR